jgi:hypothetical protein
VLSITASAMAISSFVSRLWKCCKLGEELRNVLQPVSEDYAIFNKKAKAIEIVASRNDFRLKMASSEDGRPALLHPAKLKNQDGRLQHFQNRSPTQRLVTAISCREIPFASYVDAGAMGCYR